MIDFIELDQTMDILNRAGEDPCDPDAEMREIVQKLNLVETALRQIITILKQAVFGGIA